jgi:hypothetical protein
MLPFSSEPEPKPTTFPMSKKASKKSDDGHDHLAATPQRRRGAFKMLRIPKTELYCTKRSKISTVLFPSSFSFVEGCFCFVLVLKSSTKHFYQIPIEEAVWKLNP